MKYVDSSLDWMNKNCNTFAMNFVALPLSGLIPAFFYKVQVVFPSFRRSLLETLKAIDKYKCVSLSAAPKFLTDLLASPDLNKFDTSSIRYVFSGGQIVTNDLIERCFDKWPLHFFGIMYGMTEILVSTFICVDDPRENKSKRSMSIGRIFPTIEAKVINPETGQTLPHNNVGELCIKSPYTFDGYWNEPNKTKEMMDQDGWFVLRFKLLTYFFYSI